MFRGNQVLGEAWATGWRVSQEPGWQTLLFRRSPAGPPPHGKAANCVSCGSHNYLLTEAHVPSRTVKRAWKTGPWRLRSEAAGGRQERSPRRSLTRAPLPSPWDPAGTEGPTASPRATSCSEVGFSAFPLNSDMSAPAARLPMNEAGRKERNILSFPGQPCRPCCGLCSLVFNCVEKPWSRVHLMLKTLVFPLFTLLNSAWRTPIKESAMRSLKNRLSVTKCFSPDCAGTPPLSMPGHPAAATQRRDPRPSRGRPGPSHTNVQLAPDTCCDGDARPRAHVPGLGPARWVCPAAAPASLLPWHLQCRPLPPSARPRPFLPWSPPFLQGPPGRAARETALPAG